MDSLAEVRRLRRALRDFVALSTVPAAWVGRDPPDIAAGLAEVLTGLLQLDFAFVRLCDPGGAAAVDATSGNTWSTFPEWLHRRLSTGGQLSHREIIPDVGEAQPHRGVVIPVGVNAEGGLVAAACGRTDFPSDIDDLLLATASNHAAMAFQNARLIHERRRAEDQLREARNDLEVRVVERTADVQRSRAELAASRARIVTAADETRRRIERDLHDGVQQRLVSLGLALRMAQATVPSELREAHAQLSQLSDGMASAVDELQEISRGIHPAVLTNGGLAPALKALARRSAIPVELEVELRAEMRLPEPVEVAAYYVVSEALTNAAKHSHASTVDVGANACDGVLELSIRDDGDGGADATRGSGLIGLTDRVEALGGTIEMNSPLGEGTTLLVSLPTDEGPRRA
jgi:signal transduction histidine kinase